MSYQFQTQHDHFFAHNKYAIILQGHDKRNKASVFANKKEEKCTKHKYDKVHKSAKITDQVLETRVGPDTFLAGYRISGVDRISGRLPDIRPDNRILR